MRACDSITESFDNDNNEPFVACDVASITESFDNRHINGLACDVDSNE
jgi:hypothetical protein